MILSVAFMIDNVTFVKQLQELSNNRFALNTLTADAFDEFYRQLLATFHLAPSRQWYLIGTEGCHLCQLAWQMLHASNTAHDIMYLELTDSTDVVIDHLGWLIPILLTPKGLLCHPFGIMDIVQLQTKQ
ncbi:MAG: hypothetical protein Q4A69_02335 [Moraxella sp.]|nr:hypothetical protein [Moraxella sp.]